MTNILTIDFEDWHQLVQRRVSGNLLPPTDGVMRQLDVLLELLERHKTQATFFVLGMLAQAYPDLVKRIAAKGHEIASHSYTHVTIDRLSKQEFAEDCKRAKGLLEDLTGKPVAGYRAAEFSIRQKTLWALDILAEQGFRYDSSIFPIHHRRYGIAGFHSRVSRYRLRNGLQIIEIPPATLALGRLSIPVAGGGYFRVMPDWLIRLALGRLEAERKPFVAYFHPYEFDVKRLNIFERFRPSSWTQRLRGTQLNLHQNLGRRTMSGKLAGLLSRWRFTSCQEFLEGEDRIESGTLFSDERRGSPT